MRKILLILESISQWSGRVVCWCCLALVLVLGYDVFMRYALARPTIFAYEIAIELGVAIGAGGLAYTHLHHGHVRVDVFWSRLSPKGKAIADVIASLLFFFPVVIFMTYISAQWLQAALETGEVMARTYLYPPAWPVRTVMTLGIFVFMLQGVAKLIRDIYLLRGTELEEVSYD